MWYAVIPSGSLDSSEVTSPTWAKPTVYWPIHNGCLARVLRLSGLDWGGELVMVLDRVPPEGSKVHPRYRVVGRLGTTVLPYYALHAEEDSQS